MSDTKVELIKKDEPEKKEIDITVRIQAKYLNITTKEYAKQLNDLSKKSSGSVSIEYLLWKLSDIIEKL